MMRSILGVVVGAIVTVVVYQIGAMIALLATMGIPLGASPRPPSVSYFAINLGFSVIAGIAGGRTATRIIRRQGLAYVAPLAVVLAIFALWGFTRPESQWPRWYAPVLAVVVAAGTIIGGTAFRKPSG